MTTRTVVRPWFDCPLAAEVSRKAFDPLRATYWPTAEHQARESENSKPLAYVAAMQDGQIVGTTRVRIDEPYLFIIGLAVDPACQRQGIARAIIDWLWETARRFDRGLALATIRETGNVEVFRRLGFAVVKEEVATWCESDRFAVLHDVYMVREADSLDP